MYTNMTTEKALEILEQHNLWRRGAKVESTDPTLLGMAIDKAIEVLRLSVMGVGFTKDKVVETDVIARYSLKDMEQIFFAGYFHSPIKNDETEEGLNAAFKAVIDRHNSNLR